jgi:hypothetical protein
LAQKCDAALAEFQRNGITPPPESIFEALAGHTYDQPLAPLPPDRQYRSAADAVEIPKEEIRNFAPLTMNDAKLFGDAYAEAVWGKDIQTSDWRPDDVRWTLTPAAVRKLKRKQLAK